MAWITRSQLTARKRAPYTGKMKDTVFRLQDKTVLLTGPFNGVTQALIRTMTEFGADVAFAGEAAPGATRYADGINEAREVHPEYGRAAAIPLPMRHSQDIAEILGRITESLGRVDVLIDASALAWNGDTDVLAALDLCRSLAAQVLPFLAAKHRGRMVYVFEDESLETLRPPAISPAHRQALGDHISAFATVQRGKNINVNGLALGVTEDYLLRHFPSSGSLKKSLEALQTEVPGLKMLESSDVGWGAAYLSSPLSASLTGSILRLTHGLHLAQRETEPSSDSFLAPQA